jgi:predicted RNase H-like nuclease
LVAGELVDWRADLGDNGEIVAWVGKWLGAGDAAVIAVDAPLRVPNEAGRRACEAALAADWRRFDAGPHPANRRRLAEQGVVRGEALTAELGAAYEFVEAAPVVAEDGGRFICEVYPHPAHVSLFGLDRILRYKAKPRRSYTLRWEEFRRYQQLLRSLAEAQPPLRGAEALLDVEATGRRGRALKELEDALDALTCAYLASYFWAHGPAGTQVYGTVASGHILTPRRLG